MAVQTPAHAQGFYLHDHLHLVNPSVTDRTAHTLIHMSAVVEISIIGRFVDTHPFDGDIILPAVSNQVQLLTFRFDQIMTVHTGLCWWNIGFSGFFNRCMTVSAVNAQIACMQFMTVLNWLFGTITYISKPWRGKIPEEKHRSGEYGDSAETCEDRQSVRPFWKDLARNYSPLLNLY